MADRAHRRASWPACPGAQTSCFSFARTKPTAAAPRSTWTGLLFTNLVVRLGSPFKVARACFTTRGLTWTRFETTASAEPVFLVAFAATFRTDLLTDFPTDLAEIRELFGFELMR